MRPRNRNASTTRSTSATPTIGENARVVLEYLAGTPADSQVPGEELSRMAHLNPAQVNDAVQILVQDGLATWTRVLGKQPYGFGVVSATARGRFESQRSSMGAPTQNSNSKKPTAHGSIASIHRKRSSGRVTRPRPAGSPFGFSDRDWKVVEARRSDLSKLFVVLGHQFKSKHFDTARLRKNIRLDFAQAIKAYNGLAWAVPAALDFRSLAAGYGEHLFNEIARDIISADIAVFDTSDLNPNVMLEMGVALTYGVSVLVIKKERCREPPSDISGQTWADYSESGARFIDDKHATKLLGMVERAVRSKGRL